MTLENWTFFPHNFFHTSWSTNLACKQFHCLHRKKKYKRIAIHNIIFYSPFHHDGDANYILVPKWRYSSCQTDSKRSSIRGFFVINTISTMASNIYWTIFVKLLGFMCGVLKIPVIMCDMWVSLDNKNNKNFTEKKRT